MTSTFPAHLLPATARAARDGLEIGGLPVADLVTSFGSPLIVYDEKHLRARCGEIRSAFPDGASYASKAFHCRGIAQLVHEEGLGLDVASGGELAIALAAGVPPERLTLHGNNKSLSELHAALTVGVGRIVVDSDDELNRLETLAHEMTTGPRVLVRVNPSVAAVDTHRSIRTGHEASKFGVALEDGRAEALVCRVRQSRRMRFGGVHIHIGSQMTDLAPLRQAIGSAASFASSVDAEELIVGGGLGVSYGLNDNAPNIATWGALARQSAEDGGFRGPVLAEPGRVLTATAAVTLYTIGTIKRRATTTLLAVDGGISDNPRPALYQSVYHPLLVRHPYATADIGPYTVVGKNCESSDTFARDVDIPGNPQLGDVLCFPVTGAYTYAMASHYNGLGRPAVVLVRDGAARPILRRETVEDLLRVDLVS